MTDSLSPPPAPAQPKAKSPSPWVRLGIELGPLVLFFVVNGQLGIYWATGIFMAAMAMAVAFCALVWRHVPLMIWVNAALVLVFGGLTLYLHDDTFIKIKPTLIYLFFAGALTLGLLTGKPVMQSVLGDAYPAMTARGWMLLSRNWAIFFLIMALLNEAVWRTQSTDFWVGFKTWGVLPLSLIFGMMQAPLMTRHGTPTSQSPASQTPDVS